MQVPLRFGESPPSRYIRCCPALAASVQLQITPQASLRHLSQPEATALAAEVRKRNVFARHSWENSFYVSRAQELGGNTILEIFEVGTPNEVIEAVRRNAEFLEKLIILASTFTTSRRDLHRRIGRSQRFRSPSDLIIAPQFRYIRAQSATQSKGSGLPVNARFARSFERNGFGALANVPSTGGLPERIRAAVDWLYESRMDTNVEASIVKTAIAFERLLVFSESESLAKALSERTAFILSDVLAERETLSSVVKRFYDLRSGVVHGSRKKRTGASSPKLLETADRLGLLLCLRLANNFNLWGSVEALRQWCERRKWGEADSSMTAGFPRRTLAFALRVAQNPPATSIK